MAFSRATKLSNICAGTGFSIHWLTAGISKGKKLMNKLHEDIQLNGLSHINENDLIHRRGLLDDELLN